MDFHAEQISVSLLRKELGNVGGKVEIQMKLNTQKMGKVKRCHCSTVFHFILDTVQASLYGRNIMLVSSDFSYTTALQLAVETRSVQAPAEATAQHGSSSTSRLFTQHPCNPNFYINTRVLRDGKASPRKLHLSCGH